jgi:hypothetical protein
MMIKDGTISTSRQHSTRNNKCILYMCFPVSSFSTSRNQFLHFFSFIFWYFFSTRNTQIGTPQSITSIRCNMWSIENHDCSPKPMPKLQSPKQLPSVIFFLLFYFWPAPAKWWIVCVKFWELSRKHNNVSIGVPSEKLCPFQGGPSELGFCDGVGESDANRVGWKYGVAAADKGDHTTEPKHDLNQQQKYELGHKLNTTDSERESCKRLNTALGRGKPNRLHNLFFGFSVDYRTKTKTRVRVNWR